MGDFAWGLLIGALFTYSLCLFLYRDMRRDDAWSQENESRRNHRWPVTEGTDSEGTHDADPA